MLRLKCFFVGVSLILSCRFAAGQNSNADMLEQRIEQEKRGKAAAEAAERLREGRFGAGISNTSEVALRAIRKE